MKKEKKVKSIKQILRLSPQKRYEYLTGNFEDLLNENHNGEYIQKLIGECFVSVTYENEGTEKDKKSILKHYENDNASLENMKNQTWYINHLAIMQAVSENMEQNNRLPAVTELARITKLSRTTITKHLKDFDQNEYFKQNSKMFELAKEKLMCRLYEATNNYNDNTKQSDRLKATDLFLKYCGKLYDNKQEQGTQTFIQVNNIYIDNKSVQALPKDKRNEIEKIFLNANSLNQHN